MQTLGDSCFFESCPFYHKILLLSSSHLPEVFGQSPVLDIDHFIPPHIGETDGLFQPSAEEGTEDALPARAPVGEDAVRFQDLYICEN
jgi:hypothetical protein